MIRIVKISDKDSKVSLRSAIIVYDVIRC